MLELDAHNGRTRPGDWIAFGLVVALPLLLFVLLVTGAIFDPVWANPEMHFYIVTLIAIIAVGMAIFMAISALSLKDMRVLLLSVAYLSSSFVLLVHAVTTPGVLVAMNPWVGFSGDFGIMLAGGFLALASLSWSPAFQRKVLKHSKPILWTAVGFLIAYVLFTTLTAYTGHASHFGFLTEDPFPLIGTALTYGLLWFSLFRYVQLYLSHPSPVILGVLASVVLLIETVISMTNSDLWLVSWWLHHGMLFGAFVVVVSGIALQFRRRSTLRGVLEGLLLRDSLIQVEREYTDTIIALIAAVEARDPYTHGHSANVAKVSEQLGRQLGMRGEALETLHLAALLHDIGKIGISDSVLLKPGKLTESEFASIQEHPARGEEIVSKIGALRACLPGIRSHHERLDGSGYPDGLSGDQIPLFARIIAVADCFDAMTSERPYRGPMSDRQAIAIIQSEAGTKLDPIVVAALVEILKSPSVDTRRTERAVLAAD